MINTDIAAKIIKEYEGCRLKRYQCEAGKWTIGYGHLCSATQEPITQEQAEKWFVEDLECAANGLWRSLKPVTLLVTTNEFNAMLSLVFNIGITQFNNSTLLRLYLIGEIDAVAEEFLRWKFAKGKESPGLLKRRKKERKLFLTV